MVYEIDVMAYTHVTQHFCRNFCPLAQVTTSNLISQRPSWDSGRSKKHRRLHYCFPSVGAKLLRCCPRLLETSKWSNYYCGYFANFIFHKVLIFMVSLLSPDPITLDQYTSKFLVGVCGWVLQTLTLFRTKYFIFRYPF